MGSASAALKKITPLYISREKFTVISAVLLRQHFETGDLKLFSNLDLTQIRILKAIQDQASSNKICLGQGSISVCIIKGGIWVSGVKNNLKEVKNVLSPFFPSIHDLTIHKEQVKHRIILLPFSISFIFLNITTSFQNQTEKSCWEAHTVWCTLEIQMLSRSYHTILPYRHFHNLYFTKTFASSSWGITHFRPHF